MEESISPKRKAAAPASPNGSPSPSRDMASPPEPVASSQKSLTSLDISPAAEDLFPSTVLDRAVIGLGRISGEIKITVFTLLAFILIFILIFLFRPSQEEQGGFITEQLRIFKEQHGGSTPREAEPSDP